MRNLRLAIQRPITTDKYLLRYDSLAEETAGHSSNLGFLVLKCYLK